MTTRDRTVLMVLGVFALMAAFYFGALKPKREEVTALDEKVSLAQTRLDSARAAVAAGTKARTTYRADVAAVARLAKAVPADDDTQSLLFQLERAADRAMVDFRSVELAGGGAAVAAPAAASTPAGQVAAVAAETNGKEAAAGTSTTTTAAVPATQTAAAGLPPGASVGAAGFPTMPFDFTFTGRFFRLESFLEELDRLTQIKKGGGISVHGRLLTVDGFSLAASSAGFPSMVAQIRATAYLQPEEASAGGAAATPSAPQSEVSNPAGSTPATPVATAGVGR